MSGNLLFVNARIKSLENNLLNQLQLSRIIDADTLADAYKILQECGYGAGLQIEDYRSYEQLIASKEQSATDFFKENLIEKTGLDAVLLKNDYHNAKVLIKGKYLRLTDVSDMLLPDGNYDSDNMKTDIYNDDYSALPELMAEALDAIDVAFANGNRSSRFIDITMDKAMFADMWKRIKKYKQNVLIDWLTIIVDTANISSFIRAKKLNLNNEYFIEGFIEGGKLNLEFYTELYEQSLETFKEKSNYTDYGTLVSIALDGDNGLVSYEAAVDNYINKMFKDNKYDMFSVAPIIGYYFGQLTEIKVIKLSMSTLKNKLDKNILKQRLKELYA